MERSHCTWNSFRRSLLAILSTAQGLSQRAVEILEFTRIKPCYCAYVLIEITTVDILCQHLAFGNRYTPNHDLVQATVSECLWTWSRSDINSWGIPGIECPIVWSLPHQTQANKCGISLYEHHQAVNVRQKIWLHDVEILMGSYIVGIVQYSRHITLLFGYMFVHGMHLYSSAWFLRKRSQCQRSMR